MRHSRFILALLGLFALTLPSTPRAASWVVRPDGTGDAPTIQAAVDAAATGDSIELAPGTFRGEGNRDVTLGGKSLHVRSQGGAAVTILDCEGTGEAPHRAFAFSADAAEDANVAIEGITFRGGLLAGAIDNGGAILASGPAARLTVASCIFEDNRTAGWGGAIAIVQRARATIDDCIFVDNEAARGGALLVFSGAAAQVRECDFRTNAATRGGAGYVNSEATADFSACLFDANEATGAGTLAGSGGALFVNASTATLTRCTLAGNRASASSGGGVFAQVSQVDLLGSTLWGNEAATGGGISCALGATITVANTIVAGSVSGGSVACSAGSVLLSCSVLHGNAGGDWPAEIADQAGVEGNLSLDPLLCDPDAGDFSLRPDSPCAPFSAPNPECDRIGARSATCGVQPVVSQSWGEIKARFR